MQRKTKLAMAAAAAVAVAGGGAGVAAATGGDDGAGTPIAGADLERASTAALSATGGGRVTDTEVGDEDSYYEVEVTLDDGSQVDVQLDKDFQLVKTMADQETGDAGEGGSD